MDAKTSIGNNVLVIPKITFVKAYFPNDMENNNLETGIMSIYPINDGPLLLASHSGNGLHSYFRRLEELEVNDEFYLREDNLEKKYQIIEKEYKDKDGKLNVKSDNNIVILLTCSKKIKDKQVYFIGQKVV